MGEHRRPLKTINPKYVYNASVLKVHDGDTLDVSIDLGLPTRRKDADLGFHVYITSGRVCMHVALRLAECNAAELGTPGGDAAAVNLMHLLPAGTWVTVHSMKPMMPIETDKFGGRWDADLTLADGTDLVTSLIEQQWLASWDGKGAKPVPTWPRTVAA